MITIDIRVVCAKGLSLAVIPRVLQPDEWEQVMLVFFMRGLRAAMDHIGTQFPNRTEMTAPWHIVDESAAKLGGGIHAKVIFGHGLYLVGRPDHKGNVVEMAAWLAFKLALDEVSDFFAAGRYGASASEDVEKVERALKAKLAALPPLAEATTGGMR